MNRLIITVFNNNSIFNKNRYNKLTTNVATDRVTKGASMAIFIENLFYVWLWQVIQTLAAMAPLGAIYIIMLTVKKARARYGIRKT